MKLPSAADILRKYDKVKSKIPFELNAEMWAIMQNVLNALPATGKLPKHKIPNLVQFLLDLKEEQLVHMVTQIPTMILSQIAQTKLVNKVLEILETVEKESKSSPVKPSGKPVFSWKLEITTDGVSGKLKTFNVTVPFTMLDESEKTTLCKSIEDRIDKVITIMKAGY